MAHGKEEKLWFGLLNPTYMYIWVALLILTVIEVLVPEPGLIGLPEMARTVTVVSLILLALIKTVLVAAYYMHLIGERPSLIAIACAPFLFSIFLTVGLFPYPGDVEVVLTEEAAAQQAQARSAEQPQ